ncbi:MAG: methyltransferase family protein [Bacteroidota bacterium]
MKKYLVPAIFNLIIYVAPLAFNMGLLFNIKLAVLVIAAFALLLTQPPLSAKEAKAKKRTDHNSVYAIMLAAMVSQMSVVIEWAYMIPEQARNGSTVVTIIGLVILVSGVAFRVWSIRTLGRFFTSTVQVQNSHKVISTGPYALVRHPSYLGALTAMVGSAVFMNAFVAAIITVVGMLIAYRLRIAAEEQTLASALGEEYKVYMQKTPRLIPCVW